MRIISIDVGIKNLSICLFENNPDNFEIIKWDLINLMDKETISCCIPECKNEVKYMKEEKTYCLKHGKKTNYLVPTKELNSYLKWRKNRNQTRAELEAKYSIDTKHALHAVRLLRMAK